MILALHIGIYALMAAGLAVWVDARWPRLRPGFSKRLLAWVLSAMLATSAPPSAYARAGVVMAWLADYLPWLDARAGTRAGVSLLGTLIVAYAFLVSLWVLRAWADHAKGGGGGIPAKVDR